ncbi:MAG: winged helix-turn-helix domain-containing protein [Chloroflexota bacterium]|nr:winged helix-turn-helix domain-containing protein [Chloroflexota bacterium]
MSYPKQSEIELPILLEVESAGGEIRPNAAFFQEIATYFPQLTDEDLHASNRTGINTWENKVHWARLRLVHKGELDKSRYGVWRMTDKGRERIKSAVGEATEAQRKKESIHSQLGRKLEEIGRVLGKYARRELKEGPYSYDVIWKDAEWLPRVTHVFEVQDKGNVLEALVRLKHAYDNWGARLFLVVTGEKDRTRVEKLLVPYFSGAFHEIGPVTTVLSPEEVDDLHSTLTRFRHVFGRFVAR